MLPLRYAFRWRLAGVLLLVAVFLSTMLPAIWLFPNLNLSRIIHFDKFAHGIVFLFLAIWFTGQYAPRAWWRIAAGLTVFGIAIELAQRLTVYRMAEWQDLLADVIGIGAGLLIAAAGTGGWSLRLEKRLLERSRTR